MTAKEKLKTIWEQSGDFVCGELEDGRYGCAEKAVYRVERKICQES